MWRPDEWNTEEIKRRASGRYNLVDLLKKQKEDDNFHALPTILNALIEETADTILEALRKKGLENSDPQGREGRAISRDVDGTIVFIPDDGGVNGK